MERFSRRGMSAHMSSVACGEGTLSKSFRPEDEAKLTLKDFQAIESEFAQAVGYGDHQRLCGVHKNTTQMHLHVAYNMIHPEKLMRHEPYRDYLTRGTGFAGSWSVVLTPAGFFIKNSPKEVSTFGWH